MLLGRVDGTVVSTQKDPGLSGHRFLLVRQVDVDGSETGAYVVASDAVGAGVGEIVLYASGSSARQTELTEGRACDAVVMAIVDSWEVGGHEVYTKGGGA